MVCRDSMLMITLLAVGLFQSVRPEQNLFELPALRQVVGPYELGDGPIWDPVTGLLYFLDVLKGDIHSYNPVDGRCNSINVGGSVTPLVKIRNSAHKFVIGMGMSLYTITWTGKESLFHKTLLGALPDPSPVSRFNAGKSDKHGRLWIGTMSFENDSTILTKPGSANLYAITKNTIANPQIAVPNITIGTGMAWNRDNNKFYYVDTPTYRIIEYDYVNSTGNLSNCKVVFDFKSSLGGWARPDGMAIDQDDGLWVALHGAGSVVQIDPKRGKLLQQIAIPSQFITSLTWGGTNLDILFVTTAMNSQMEANCTERLDESARGYVYAITKLGTKGLRTYDVDF